MLRNKEYDVKRRIIEVSLEKGVPPHMTLATVLQESSFDPKAENKKSGATGLFQFTDEAWEDYGIGPNDPQRKNPEVQIQHGVQRIKDSISGLRKALGREPSDSELYMSHVFGPRGGKVIAKAPLNRSLISVLGDIHGPVKAGEVLNRNTWIKKNGISNIKELRIWMNKKVAIRSEEVQPILKEYDEGNMVSETDIQDEEQLEEDDGFASDHTQAPVIDPDEFTDEEDVS